MSSPSMTQSTTATTLVTTAETAVVTSPAVTVNAPGGQGVQVTGTVAGTTGAGATACTVRVRQGANTTTGTVVGAAMTELQGAAAGFSISFCVLDASVGAGASPQGTAQYTVTVQQVGATGNATMAIATVALESANAAGV